MAYVIYKKGHLIAFFLNKDDAKLFCNLKNSEYGWNMFTYDNKIINY